MVGTRRRAPVGTLIAAALLGLLALLGAGPVVAPVAARQDWVEVTDAPSGVTVALPGAAEATTVPYGRAYAPEGGDVAFAVLDVPIPAGVDLAGAVGTVAPTLGVTIVESTDTTVEGHPAVDAVVAVDRDGVSGTALVRAVVADGYVVVLVTRAASPEDPAAADLHRKLLDGARLA